MTPEAHTPADREGFDTPDAERSVLIIESEESAYELTSFLERFGYLHEGTPLPKRQREELVH